MNVFDIIGPVMIGPSSSHTAGAARIGFISRVLLNEDVASARICLHGSFAHTGKGHGTDRALVAGIMGMKPDDERLRNSLELAKDAGVDISFENVEIDGAHPNTTEIFLTGVSGKKISIQGASVGGGNIEIRRVNGNKVSISGHSPTIMVTHDDLPGMIGVITSTIGKKGYNIFQVYLARQQKGGKAVISMEIDGKTIDRSIQEELMSLDNVLDVTVLEPY